MSWNFRSPIKVSRVAPRGCGELLGWAMSSAMPASRQSCEDPCRSDLLRPPRSAGSRSPWWPREHCVVVSVRQHAVAGEPIRPWLTSESVLEISRPSPGGNGGSPGAAAGITLRAEWPHVSVSANTRTWVSKSSNTSASHLQRGQRNDEGAMSATRAVFEGRGQQPETSRQRKWSRKLRRSAKR